MSRIRLAQSLARAASLAPGRTALRFCGRRSTWRELDEEVAAVAGGLRALGVGAGDRVAIVALNSDRYVSAMFATWRLGAAIVPFNTRWSTVELTDAMADCAPSAILLDDAFGALAPVLAGAGRVVAMGGGPGGRGQVPWNELLRPDSPVDDLGGGGEDMAGIFYTGGTTGRPKGAMLSHTGLAATLLTGAGAETPAEDASLLCVLPLFHLAGAQLAIAAALATRPLIIHPGFDPAAVLAAVEMERVETLSLVPAMWAMLVDHPAAPDADLSSLRRALYGASPMPEGILRRVAARLPGAAFSQGYGQTETSGICTLLGPEDHNPDGPAAHRLRSAGRPIALSEVRVVDEAGRERARGEVGELAVRGAGNMLGYWRRSEETERTMRGGWVMTGDAGYMDSDGYVFLVDRTKDMIVSGGENVYSAETESALSSHPDVLACAVIGIPDDRWGESVHAIVVPRPGSRPEIEELIAHCRARIAGYKCPKSVELRDTPLPLSAAGKVLKRELRDPFWTGRERNVN